MTRTLHRCAKNLVLQSTATSAQYREAMNLQRGRIAADGKAYTYTDFEDWYGMHAIQLWERAVATEHSESFFITNDFVRCYGTQARHTCAACRQGVGIAKPAVCFAGRQGRLAECFDQGAGRGA